MDGKKHYSRSQKETMSPIPGEILDSNVFNEFLVFRY